MADAKQNPLSQIDLELLAPHDRKIFEELIEKVALLLF